MFERALVIEYLSQSRNKTISGIRMKNSIFVSHFGKMLLTWVTLMSNARNLYLLTLVLVDDQFLSSFFGCFCVDHFPLMLRAIKTEKEPISIQLTLDT